MCCVGVVLFCDDAMLGCSVWMGCCEVCGGEGVSCCPTDSCNVGFECIPGDVYDGICDGCSGDVCVLECTVVCDASECGTVSVMLVCGFGSDGVYCVGDDDGIFGCGLCSCNGVIFVDDICYGYVCDGLDPACDILCMCLVDCNNGIEIMVVICDGYVCDGSDLFC